MILNDKQIAELAAKGMILPFVGKQIREENSKKVISYGLSSYGYDIRLSNKFKVCPLPPDRPVIDPKTIKIDKWINLEHEYCIIRPNGFILGLSIETFDIPENIMGICVGKSTYARCGILVNITPLEAGWKGKLVMEISNTTPLPVKIYANEGIAQVIFFKGEKCHTSYTDRQGKYNYQKDINIYI